MKSSVTLVAVLVFALAGCPLAADTSALGVGATPTPSAPAPATKPATPQRPREIPDGWELVRGAVLTASQTPGEVILKANGENPSAGYEFKFVPSFLRIWPPQYLLICKKPGGPAAAVVTPYEVSASFKTKERVQTLVITDADGRHEVKVDQARD